MPYLEIAAGVAASTAIFLLYQGINILPGLLFIVLIGMVYYLNVSRNGGKLFAAISKNANVEKIDFDDIGGQEVAKNELIEALQFVKNVEKIKKLGIRPLKGIMLSGPPGTGKTLLAKAAAQYTDSVFLAAGGAEFVEMYVGVGAQRIRSLFKQAKILANKENKTSAVIFIDEIDVLGGKRGREHANIEHDQTLNELLVQLDGLSVDDSVKILLIAATNRVDMLDKALLRPGRFDRQVQVDLPDKNGRLSILKLHTRNKPLADTVNLDKIAGDTFGFSGAHLEALANEAAIMALREEKSVITDEHLKMALDKVIMGEKLDRRPTQAEKYRIAIHEAAHALMSELTEEGSVAAIHVASRSNALGYVRQTQKDDIYLYTEEYLLGKIAVALAGSIAEEICLNSRSTGAAGDIKQAAKMAKQIIFGGMSELGMVSPDDLPQNDLHQAIRTIFTEREKFVYGVVTAYKAFLEKTAEQLAVAEYIDGNEFREHLRLKNSA